MTETIFCHGVEIALHGFIFVLQGAKLSTNLYIETILNPVLLAAKKHFKEKMVQHYTHPKRHKSGAKTIFLVCRARRFCCFSHSTSTQQIFCVWYLLKADAWASSYASVEALKYFLEQASAKIPQETQCTAEEGFHSRLQLVINAKY